LGSDEEFCAGPGLLPIRDFPQEGLLVIVAVLLGCNSFCNMIAQILAGRIVSSIRFFGHVCFGAPENSSLTTNSSRHRFSSLTPVTFFFASS
jgi:hypothetical protein